MGNLKKFFLFSVFLLTLATFGNEFCTLSFEGISGTLGLLKCKNLRPNAVYRVVVQKGEWKKTFTYVGVNPTDYLPFAVPFYWNGKFRFEFLRNNLILARLDLSTKQPDRGVSRIYLHYGKRKNENTLRETKLNVRREVKKQKTKIRLLIHKQYFLIRKLLKTYTPQRFYEDKAIIPVKFYKRISSPFGVRRFVNGRPAGFHKGVDFAAPVGTPVYATLSGRVIFAGRLYLTGNTVIIDHGWGLMSLYAHLSRIEVKRGEFVKQGQEIGKVGSTGRSTGPHLHFGVYLNDTTVDPLDFLKKKLKPAEGGKSFNPPTLKR